MLCEWDMLQDLDGQSDETFDIKTKFMNIMIIFTGIGAMCLGLFLITCGLFIDKPKQQEINPWSGKQDFGEWCVKNGGSYDERGFASVCKKNKNI